MMITQRVEVMHRFPGLVLALLAAAFLAQGQGPARAEEPADSIQAVIVSQLDALQANDPAAAFAHASPGSSPPRICPSHI